MRLERTYAIEIPPVTIPASMVYAHSTRMSDFDTPDIERINKPSSTLKGHTVEIRLTSGATTTNAEARPAPHAPYDRLKYEVKRVLNRREPILDLGNRIALDMRFAHLGNFAHLVHDVLAPVRFIEKTLAEDPAAPRPPVHVIVPKRASPLEVSFLEAAGVPIIRTDGVVRGQLVTITQELNLALLPHLARQPVVTSPPAHERLFVSRRGARAILNDDAVTRFLAQQGFERVYPEDFPIRDQWAMLGNAREVVGIHGAGLASLAFSIHRTSDREPRFRLVELFSPGFSHNCFRIYAAIMRGTWVGVRGKITPDVVQELDIFGHSRAHQNSSFEVDLDALAEALVYSRTQARSHLPLRTETPSS